MPLSRLLKAKEVARFLGISCQCLHHYTQTKRITHYHVGGVIRFKLEDVEEYIRRHPGSRAFKQRCGVKKKSHLRLVKS